MSIKIGVLYRASDKLNTNAKHIVYNTMIKPHTSAIMQGKYKLSDCILFNCYY